MRRIALALLVAVTGCGFFDRVFGRDELDVLRQQRNRWRSLGIADYDYTYRQMCFCPYELTRPMRISVRGGLVSTVINLDTNEPMPPMPYVTWPTIDSIFARTEHYLKGESYKIDVTYDGAFHHPVKVVGDVPRAIDDEFTTTATDLVKVVK